MQISINQLNQSYKVSLLSITILLFFSDFCTLLPAYQVTPTSKCKYILPCSIWKFMWEKVDVLLRREKVISYFIKYVDEMDALSFAWDTTQWCFQYLFLGMSNNNHPHWFPCFFPKMIQKRGRVQWCSDKKIPTAALKITMDSACQPFYPHLRKR